MGLRGYERRLQLLPDSITGTGADCRYGNTPYHPTTPDLRKPISTTLIAFNGDDTGYGLWGRDKYQPVTNRDRLQVLFLLSSYFVVFSSFPIAKYPRAPHAHTRHHPVGNCTSTRVLDIDKAPGTPPLGRSHWFTSPVDTRAFLWVAVGSFAIASTLIFLFYFLALIGPSILTILLLPCIIGGYCIIYFAKLNMVQMAASVDGS